MPLTGADLIAAGISPGPQMGATLRKAEAAWIASDFALSRDALLRLA
jgi:poly(A) polymerase